MGGERETSVWGRGENNCKGPEVGICLVWLGDSKEASVAGAP